jgi:hypothetical protein
VGSILLHARAGAAGKSWLRELPLYHFLHQFGFCRLTLPDVANTGWRTWRAGYDDRNKL